jgi:hypothetical protein
VTAYWARWRSGGRLAAAAGTIRAVAGRGNRGPRCSATNRRGEPCGCLAHPSDGLCAFHSGRLDPVVIGRKGGQAPRASVVELRAEIKRLEAELWKARHTAKLEERKQAGPERSLAATLALIDAL